MALADSRIGGGTFGLARHTVVAHQAMDDAVPRLAWVDAFRGAAIIAVVLIHTCGACQKLRHAPDTAWFCLAELSRILQFAVPAFLMLSACVLTRSLLREPSLRRYARHRVQSVVWPAVVWNVLCVPYAHTLKPGISWRNAAWQVWTGEADFHLYFLRVILQLCVVVPLMMPLMRRRPPLWIVLLLASVLTVCLFALNRLMVKCTNPASLIFWYVPHVALGLWLGTQSKRWHEIARRGCVFATGAAIASGAVYLPLALRAIEGIDVRSPLYPISWWCYSTAVSFVLFSAMMWLSQGKLFMLAPLRYLGKYSLQVYLVHPAVLYFSEKQFEPHIYSGFVDAPLLMLVFMVRFALCIAVPLALTWLVENVRPSILLFGR